MTAPVFCFAKVIKYYQLNLAAAASIAAATVSGAGAPVIFRCLTHVSRLIAVKISSSIKFEKVNISSRFRSSRAQFFSTQ